MYLKAHRRKKNSGLLGEVADAVTGVVTSIVYDEQMEESAPLFEFQSFESVSDQNQTFLFNFWMFSFSCTAIC